MHVTITSLDLSLFEQQLGRRIDLVIGQDILSCKPFRLDFDNNLFNFDPAFPSGYQPFPLEQEQTYKLLFTRFQSNGQVLKMQIDTGDGSELRFSAPWAKQNLRDSRRSTTVISRGAGGIVTSELFTLEKLLIGSVQLTSLHTAIEPDDDETQLFGMDGVLGLGFLNRFNPVFDIAGKRLWLLPRLHAAPRFPRKTAGLLGVVDGKGQFQVMHVMPKSPAETAGWKTGELICAIDGKPVTPLTARKWGEDRNGVTTKIKLCSGTVRTLKQLYFY